MAKTGKKDLNFKRLFESAPGLYLVLDPSFRIVEVTDTYIEATMVRRSNILGRNIFDVFPDNPDDPTANGVKNLSASLNRVLQTRKPDFMPVQKYDIQRPASKGGGFERRYWSPANFPVLDAKGNVQWIIHRVEDVTASELREELLQTVINGVKDYAIFMLDSSGQVVSWNAGAQRIKGYSEVEIIGLHFQQFFPPEAQAEGAPLNFLEKAVKDGRAELETWQIRRDGTRFFANIVATTLTSALGQMFGFAIVTRDITQRRQSEEQKKALYDKTIQLDQIRSEFFANVSHELRTPITLIMGAIQKVLNKPNQPGAQAEDDRKVFELIRRNTYLLLKHVDDLLDIARLEVGKMSLRNERLDLAKLLRQIAANFELAAEEKKLSFSVKAPSSLNTLADGQKIFRVLMNLLSNAFKYTPEGGKVSCQLELDGSYALFTVTDSGCGIPVELRQTVFEKFFRVESLNQAVGGTGLGLSIVKEFVELHGGSVQITDGYDSGISVAVRIPMRNRANSQDLPEFVFPGEMAAMRLVEAHSNQGSNENVPAPLASSDAPLILLVEDNEDMSRYIYEVLVPRYRVIRAMSAKDALNQLKEQKPDLILSDIMLPEVSGTDLVLEIRKHSEWQEIPIILLTARAEDHLRIFLLKSGAQDYVTKPFAEPELMARIQNWITIKQVRDALRKELQIQEDDMKSLATQIATSRHELQSALAISVDASRVKSEFLANVSHEVRTPLNGIIGAADLLLSMPPQEERPELLHIIRDSAKVLMNLINNILDFSKISAGKQDGKTEEVHLKELIQEHIGMVAPQADHKQIRLNVSIGDFPETMKGNSSHIGQILSNLLSNAVKYTEKGRISVRARCRKASDGRSLARIMIKDTGIGISKEDQQRVFDPFVQVDSSARRRFGGMGLGLTICKELVNVIGGKIGLVSKPGKGCLVWFEFPFSIITESPAISISETSSRESISIRNGICDQSRVLVVEDNSFNSHVIQRQLQKLDCLVRCVNSGRAAIDMVQSENYDLILMDCQMPEMDGFETARELIRLQREQNRKQIPIVALTAHALRADMERCLAAGMVDHVSKPVTLAQLSKILSHWIPKVV